MSEENLKLVIVGHVDHGKSTLVGRLLYDTGSLPKERIEEIKSICEALGKKIEFSYVMDNLAEERGQGITIDTAQAFFKTKRRQYTIIDAPGHIEFIKNMITGASQADAAIIIVDVREGVSEQTRRHSYILGMLGLRQVIVAINKMDLAGYKEGRFRKVSGEIQDFLESIKIKPVYVIPISAREGDLVAEKTRNLDWFNGPTILEALDTFEVPESQKDRPIRFPIQDVYKFDDNRIFVGMISSGTIHPGEEVIALPSREKTRIKNIIEWQSDRENPFGLGGYHYPESAQAGKSTGVTLEDKLFLDRGDVISTPQDQPKIADKFNAHIFWLDREPYRKGERIKLKCATQEIMCEIERIGRVLNSSTLKILAEDAGEIKTREVADITVKTSRPVVIENFNNIPGLGRFVFEREDTCAGGIITGI